MKSIIYKSTTKPQADKLRSGIGGLILAVILINWTPTSHAVGLGIDMGTSEENWSRDSGGDRETMHFGGVLDTAPAGYTVLNYRLTVGKESNYLSNNGYRVHYSGLAMTHTFGLRLAQGPSYRLWLGPQVKFTYYDEFQDRNFFGSNNEYDGFIRGYGAGLVIGYNLNLTRPVSLSFTGGTRYMRYSGSYDRNTGQTAASEVAIEDEVVGNFFGFSVIFRLGENY